MCDFPVSLDNAAVTSHYFLRPRLSLGYPDYNLNKNITRIDQSQVLPQSYAIQDKRAGEEMANPGRMHSVPTRLIKNRSPRNPTENKANYARRLKLLFPSISLIEAAEISETRVRNIQQLPEFNELSIEGRLANNTMPMIVGERPSMYARRLKAAYPDLDIKDFCHLSGMNKTSILNLPEFAKISSSALRVHRNMPQQEDELPIDYARRIKLANPNLRPSDYSAISGISIPRLRCLGLFNKYSVEAQFLSQTTPRLKNEKAIDFALRLKKICPYFTLEEYSFLSGETITNLNKRVEFVTLTPELEKIAHSVPRLAGEKNTAYARRLKHQYPDLSLEECFKIVGGRHYNLQNMPEFKVLSVAGEVISQFTSKNNGETNLQFACRLKDTYPQLDIDDISKLANVSSSGLKHRARFKRLSPAAQAIISKSPKFPQEESIDYIRRLRVSYPNISVNDCSALSGIEEFVLRKLPEFTRLSSKAQVIKVTELKEDNESDSHYVSRIIKNHPDLMIKDYVGITGVDKKEVRIINRKIRQMSRKSREYVKGKASMRAPSPSFEKQLEQAIQGEMYRNDWTIEDVFS